MNKYNKTNVSQQIQTDKDGDWRWETGEPRRAYKAPETFRLEAFRSIFIFFRLFLLQKSSWLGARQTAGRRLRDWESGNRHSRATYFVLNLLVHTNALLTVFRFRFRFHFVFSSFFVIVVVLFCLLGLEASSFG